MQTRAKLTPAKQTQSRLTADILAAVFLCPLTKQQITLELLLMAAICRALSVWIIRVSECWVVYSMADLDGGHCLTATVIMKS